MLSQEDIKCLQASSKGPFSDTMRLHYVLFSKRYIRNPGMSTPHCTRLCQDLNCRTSSVFTVCSNSFSLLLIFFVRASIVLYVTFVLSLFVPHLSFSWCVGKALLHNYGNFLGIFSYIFGTGSLVCIHPKTGFVGTRRGRFLMSWLDSID